MIHWTRETTVECQITNLITPMIFQSQMTENKTNKHSVNLRVVEVNSRCSGNGGNYQRYEIYLSDFVSNFY